MPNSSTKVGETSAIKKRATSTNLFNQVSGRKEGKNDKEKTSEKDSNIGSRFETEKSGSKKMLGKFKRMQSEDVNSF